MDDPFDAVKLLALAIGLVISAALWSLGVHAAEAVLAAMRPRVDDEDDRIEQTQEATAAAFRNVDRRLKKWRKRVQALEERLERMGEKK